MVETASNMLPLGTKAPDFNLIDTCSGKTLALNSLKSDKATVIMFICNHCPYVKHIQKKIVDIATKYQQQGVSFIAINSNDAEKYPADNPEKMKLEAKTQGYTFPYLYDETQAVAKAYQAACTPDFYLFDKNLACVYRGRFDRSTPGNHYPVTGEDLIQAIENILSEKPIDPDQYHSLGCNIKWKK